MFKVIGPNVGGRKEGEDTGILPFADAPDVEIDDVDLDWSLLHDFQDFSHHRCIHLGIEQDATGVTKESLRPNCHQNGADDTHNRIEPIGSPKFSAGQGQNSEHRGDGISQNVEISRTQVEIMVIECSPCSCLW